MSTTDNPAPTPRTFLVGEYDDIKEVVLASEHQAALSAKDREIAHWQKLFRALSDEQEDDRARAEKSEAKVSQLLDENNRLQADVEALWDQRDQLSAEVERLKLAKHLNHTASGPEFGPFFTEADHKEAEAIIAERDTLRAAIDAARSQPTQ